MRQLNENPIGYLKAIALSTALLTTIAAVAALRAGAAVRAKLCKGV
jgi:hypothetical protein